MQSHGLVNFLREKALKKYMHSCISTRHENKFLTSIYRKPTFSSTLIIYTNVDFSLHYYIHKRGLLLTLLYTQTWTSPYIIIYTNVDFLHYYIHKRGLLLTLLYIQTWTSPYIIIQTSYIIIYTNVAFSISSLYFLVLSWWSF